MNALNKELIREASALEKELQTRVNVFIQQQKKNVNNLYWAQAKIAVKVDFSVAKFIKGAGEIAGKVGAAVTAGMTGAGVFLSLVAIKSLISSVNDLVSAWGDIRSAFEGERAKFKKLKQAVTELKKLKSPQPVPKSKVEAHRDPNRPIRSQPSRH